MHDLVAVHPARSIDNVRGRRAMNILFISHWFPPYNAIGSVRAYEMARYLDGLGHNVTVITTSHNSVPTNYDVDFGKLRVIRQKFPRVLSFIEGPLVGKIGILRRIAKRLFYPDQFALLVRPLAKVAIDAARQSENIDLIMTTALPFSLNLVGRIVSKRLAVPWIADNRDLWANTPYRRSVFGSELIDMAFERNVLAHATYVTTVGNRMTEEMKSRLAHADVFTIRNGADCRPGRRPYSDYDNGRKLTFAYTGVLYKGRRDLTPLLTALIKSGVTAKLSFYGSESETVNTIARMHPSIDIVNGGHTGKQEIKQIQQASHFLVLALADDEFDKSVLPGKFFEYMEAGRPIIALCDPESELAELIEQWHLGCACRDSERIAAFIDALLASGEWLGNVPQQLTRGFQFDSVLPDLLRRCTARVRTHTTAMESR